MAQKMCYYANNNCLFHLLDANSVFLFFLKYLQWKLSDATVHAHPGVLKCGKNPNHNYFE